MAVVKKQQGLLLVQGVLLVALLYFSYLMVLITMQYIPIDLEAAFLSLKQDEVGIVYYPTSFFVHVYSSIFVLFLGIPQFSGYFRRRFPAWHRSLGKAYIFIILLLAGPSGLIMGYHGNGGWPAQLSFCLLAMAWIYFTYMAYRSARHKQWARHRDFIYRSYALTLSAISLRLFKWIIVTLWAWPPLDTYIVVSWAGWTVNLLLAELLIMYQNRYSGLIG